MKQKRYSRDNYLRHRDKYLAKRKEKVENFKLWFETIKDTLECKVCGEDRNWVLDFHHRNPEDKVAKVAALVRGCNKEKVLKEIEKCDVLCANCHRDYHYKENLNSEVVAVG